MEFDACDSKGTYSGGGILLADTRGVGVPEGTLAVPLMPQGYEVSAMATRRVNSVSSC